MKAIIIFLAIINILVMAQTKVNLTLEEENWIKENQVLIGTEHWKPIVYKNQQSNKLDGIVGDMINIAISNLNLNTKIKSGEWKDILQSFKDKKIDLLPAVYYTKEREEFGFYSKKFFALSEYIYVKKSNKVINSFEDLNGKKLAIIKGYAMVDMVHKKYPSINIIQTKDLEDSIKLVLNGKVDALIDGQIIVENYIYDNLILDLKGIPQVSFRPNGVYLLSHINKPILRSILQKGLDSISKNQRNKIIQKWLKKSEDDDFLTLEQKQYLKNHKIIKMCNNPNWEPIEFAKNNNMSNMTGISIDTMKLLEKKLNIKFENVPTRSWSESQKFLKLKKCDILPCAVKTVAREKYAKFTKAYLNLPLAIFTASDKSIISGLDELKDKTWARKKGSGVIAKVKKLYPDTKIIETKDNTQALKLVNDEQVYFSIATIPVASSIISKYMLQNVKISGYTDIAFKLSMAVRDDKPILLDILDKTLDQISSEEKKSIMKKWISVSVKEAVVDYGLIKKLFLIVLILIIFFIVRQYLLKKTNKDLAEAVKKQTHKLKELNETLELRVKEEIAKSKEKDKQLFEQSKMAAMGEMIGNIAHQWRQPLSLISTSSTGMIFQKECGVLSDELFFKNCNAINENAQYLSKTIDDFRDYLKGDKLKKKFSINKNINSFLNLIDPTKKENNIEIILDLGDDIEINSQENELLQCYINIFNNAKDILNEKNIEDKFIFITTYQEDGYVCIEFRDNAGGIPIDVKSKIFEPYFTTKHESQGTGLGLHMTYNLIVNGMDGDIKVNNIKYTYNDIEYIGASFTIILPLHHNV